MSKIRILRRKHIETPYGVLLSFAIAERNGKIAGYCRWKKGDKKHIDSRIFGFMDEFKDNYIDNWIEDICKQVGISKNDIPSWKIENQPTVKVEQDAI